MQIGNKTIGASVVLGSLGAAATQGSNVALTWPVAIGPDTMRVLAPILGLIVPVLLTQFAPALLPVWEWVKKLLPVPSELAEYRQIAEAKAINPECPVWHQQLKAAMQRAFDRNHSPPPPEVPDAK